MINIITINHTDSLTPIALIVNDEVLFFDEDISNNVYDTAHSLSAALNIPVKDYYLDSKDVLDEEGLISIEIIKEKAKEFISDSPVLVESKIKDWDESSDGEEYAISLEKTESNFGVEIGSIDSDKPQLTLTIEIDKGVPSIHVGSQIGGDIGLHIHSDENGLNIVPENQNQVETVKNKLTYEQEGFIIKHHSPEMGMK